MSLSKNGLIALWVLLLTAIPSCSRNPLVGEWRGVEDGTNAIAMHFFKDGTATYTRSDQHIGTYALLDGSHVKMEVPQDGPLVMEFHVSGDTLTLSVPNEKTLTLSRSK